MFDAMLILYLSSVTALVEVSLLKYQNVLTKMMTSLVLLYYYLLLYKFVKYVILECRERLKSKLCIRMLQAHILQRRNTVVQIIQTE